MSADTVTIPRRAGDTYQELAAWYSGFAFCEHYRKIVLAQCREIERAKAASAGKKITVDQCDDLARLHPAYLDYLAKHLVGRIAWEKSFLAQGGMR